MGVMSMKKIEQSTLFDINQYQKQEQSRWGEEGIGDDPAWLQPQPEFSVGDLVCDRIMKRHGDRVFKIMSFSKNSWVHLEACDGIDQLKTMLPLNDLRNAKAADLSYVTAETIDTQGLETKVLHKTRAENNQLSYVTKSEVDDPKVLHKTSTDELPELSYVTESGVDDPKVLHKTSTDELPELSYVTKSEVDDPKVLHKTSTNELPDLSYVTESGVDDPKVLHKTLARVKSDCLLLTHQERVKLRDWLNEAIASDEVEIFDAPIKSNREVVEIRREGAVVYQLEKVRCGKGRCRSCPHGPYWYAYSRKGGQGGKVVSKYIGKNY